LTRADTKGNLVRGAADITNSVWNNSSNVTRNSGTLCTFTAQNGHLKVQIPGNYHEQDTYTLSAKIRNISGNTSLTWNIDGTQTAFTIDGTLTKYSKSFTAPAFDSAFYVGIQDTNAAGHGQIEIDEIQLRKNTWSADFVEDATNYQMVIASPLTNGNRAFLFAESDQLYQFDAGANTFGPPFTVYITVMPNPWHWPGRMACLGTEVYDWFLSFEPNTVGAFRVYTTSGSPKEIVSGGGVVTSNNWHVLSVTHQNGGTCSIRHNLDAAITGTLENVGTGRVKGWGGEFSDSFYSQMYSTDLILRKGVDDATTQANYIRYLADRVGLSL
jgi:hypothetical protein